MRPIKVTKNFVNSVENSVLYESGMTKVLVTVSISTRVPDWLLNSNKGWVTAEYNMLPGSSGKRISRKSYEGGAWIALNDTFEQMLKEKKLNQNPLTSKVGAISVGIVKGDLVADLDYEKDSNAEVDLNLVMDERFEILEIQGTAEGKPFSKNNLDQLFEIGKECIEQIFKIQE